MTKNHATALLPILMSLALFVPEGAEPPHRTALRNGTGGGLLSGVSILS